VRGVILKVMVHEAAEASVVVQVVALMVARISEEVK